MAQGALGTLARFEANAIIDRLVADGETFDQDDARRLIELVPVHRRPYRFSFSGLFRSPSSSATGQAAGVGDVKVDEEASEKSFSVNAPRQHRIGGYVVTHEPGEIEIGLMWADTREDATGERCCLYYDLGSGAPRELRLCEQRDARFLFLVFTRLVFRPWKLPARTSAPAT